MLPGVEAVGKHLLHRFGGEEVLHVHLGLFGRFREHRAPPPPPRGAGAPAEGGAGGDYRPLRADRVRAGGGEGRARIMRRAERTYVYGQEACRRCGSDIARVTLGSRPCHHCPTCQR